MSSGASGPPDQDSAATVLPARPRDPFHNSTKSGPLGKGDICASFQRAVCLSLADRLDIAFSRFAARFPDIADRALVIAGAMKVAYVGHRESVGKVAIQKAITALLK